MPRSAAFIALTLTLISGCANLERSPSHRADAQSLAEPRLYSLLVAELATQRNQPDLAHQHYQQLAKQLRRPELAERATYLAQYLELEQDVLDNAKLWLELDNQALEGAQILLDAHLRQHQFAEALALLKGFDWRADTNLFLQLLARTEQLKPPQTELMDSQLEQLLPSDNPYYYLTKALLARQELRWQGAHQALDQALQLEPGLEHGLLLKADTLLRQGAYAEAERFIRSTLKRQPNTQLMDMLARSLLADNRPQAAATALQELIKLQPDNLEARFMLGRTYLQLKDYPKAKARFMELWEMLPDRSPIAFYLGYLAEQQNQTFEAMRYYREVQRGDEVPAAKARLLQLMQQQQQGDDIPDMLNQARSQAPEHRVQLYLLEGDWLRNQARYQDARDLMGRALNEEPNNLELLYFRAMLGDKDGNLEAMLRDLRTLVQLQPDNAQMLNALGYTLTDRTDQHQEALTLLQRAHELEPQDPAILDSLGWAYHNLKRPQEALPYLEAAYQAFPDPEVAYHYGVVLLELQQSEQALQVWHKALEQQPDYQPILQALKAYHAQP